LEGDISAALKSKSECERETAAVRQALEAETALGYTDISDLNTADRSSVNRALNRLELGKNEFSGVNADDMENELHNQLSDNWMYLAEYAPVEEELFEQIPEIDLKIKRLDIQCIAEGRKMDIIALNNRLKQEIEAGRRLNTETDHQIYERKLCRLLAEVLGRRISQCAEWVSQIDKMLRREDISGGLSLGVSWVRRKLETQEERDTGELLDLLEKYPNDDKEEYFEQIAAYFTARINLAQKIVNDVGRQSLYSALCELLDYRTWFDFHLNYVKTGKRRRELTKKAFSQFSALEKALSVYAPLFCAAAVKYDMAADGAPRVISLDGSFAGIDGRYAGDIYKLMLSCGFSFIINSQDLRGEYETVPGLAIYSLQRRDGFKYGVAERYVWDEHKREAAADKIIS